MRVVLFLLLAGWSSMALANDNTKNRYVCFKIRVNPENHLYVHQLADNIHELEIQWWDWTLNLSLIEQGQLKEKIGAASNTQVKLRSRDPSISIYCNRE